MTSRRHGAKQVQGMVMQYNSGSLLLVLLILGDWRLLRVMFLAGLYRDDSKPQVGLHSSGRQHLNVCMQPVMESESSLLAQIPDNFAVQI